jgi:hypothetical protein
MKLISLFTSLAKNFPFLSNVITEGKMILWRVVQEQYIDKQIYRDGGAIEKVTNLYRHVAEILHLLFPCQQVIVWRGSEII